MYKNDVLRTRSGKPKHNLGKVEFETRSSSSVKFNIIYCLLFL